jgi:hypothetical protein
MSVVDKEWSERSLWALLKVVREAQQGMLRTQREWLAPVTTKAMVLIGRTILRGAEKVMLN